ASSPLTDSINAFHSSARASVCHVFDRFRPPLYQTTFHRVPFGPVRVSMLATSGPPGLVIVRVVGVHGSELTEQHFGSDDPGHVVIIIDLPLVSLDNG